MVESQDSVAESYLSWRRGDSAAWGVLYSITFGRLRAIAARLLAHERVNHTLQPTALVNEFFLKLCGHSMLRIKSESHFFNAAARAMGQTLIDYARRKKAAKRILPEMIPDLLIACQTDASRSGLDAMFAFRKLEQLDPVAAKAVWLRSVEEMTIDETAAAQGMERWRVRENYNFGVKWLAGKLTAWRSR